MSERNSTAPASTGKPAKPYAEFPLFAHATRRWAKKIRGKLHYFGPWDDPDGALAKYEAEKDALHSGRTPRSDPKAMTVKDIANVFLAAKLDAVKAGELSQRTWDDYHAILGKMLEHVGKQRPVNALDQQDFAALKKNLAKSNGPARMSTIIQVVRCAFKHAHDSGAIDGPVRFGPSFKRTSKKTLRLHRARQGAKLFTAEEVRRLLAAASVQLRAMLLLGINCGFGNTDCGRLPMLALDLDGGWVTYPRPKTGVARRCWLWPETVEAIQAAFAERPDPKDAENAGLVFITKYGCSWDKEKSSGPLVNETKKLLRALHINGRKGLGFYTLRHTFRTIADAARDQPAADYVMGHESPHMSTHYRELIDDERLRAVAEHVRLWLWPPEANANMKPAEDHAADIEEPAGATV